MAGRIHQMDLVRELLALEFPAASGGRREKLRFEALAAEWRVWGFQLALKITGCPEAAADAVQNALVRAYRSHGALSRADSPRAWFRKVLVRCAIDQRPRRGEPSSEHMARAFDLEQSLQVRRTLARIEPGHRAMLALALGEGLTYDEIAELLEIPSGTVGSRLHHAKEAFRRAWGDET